MQREKLSGEIRLITHRSIRVMKEFVVLFLGQYLQHTNWFGNNQQHIQMADVPTHSCLAIGLVCDEEPNGYGYLDSDPNLSISSGVGVRELEGDEAIGG